jgi:hypothetical protein
VATEICVCDTHGIDTVKDDVFIHIVVINIS